MAVDLVRNICIVLFFAVPSAYNEDIWTQQRTPVHPIATFSRHTIVKPKIYNRREKRHILTTKLEQGEHLNYLQIVLKIDDENLVLDLSLNTQLFAKDFFYKRQEDGKHIVFKPTKKEVDHCHYNGSVSGKPKSWAAISTCDGLSGVIFDGEEMYYVEKDIIVDDSSMETKHFVYKHSDLLEHNKTCGHVGNDQGGGSKGSMYDTIFRRHIRSTENKIRGPNNIKRDSRYVELLIVVDNAEYEAYERSDRKVIDHCKKLANIINGLYAQLDIFIALVGVVIWSDQDEMKISTDDVVMLENFLEYRREKLKHPNDNAQLLTKLTFGNVVGKAPMGLICSSEGSGGIIADFSPAVGLVAITMAHEMGHNFGMRHDTAACECPSERCIMAPSIFSVPPTQWSSCSLDTILFAFTHGLDYCLRNKPDFLFDSPMCGNGFVESGEECDCGLPEHCNNACCNASTCMMYATASCGTGECCDLTTCNLKSAGTLCRPAELLECDLPEYCTGESEYCPSDFYKQDVEGCDNGVSFCHHGLCGSRTDQCKLLWGETGKASNHQCYNKNTKGDQYGNCGYNRTSRTYLKCELANLLCGRLYCQHLNEKLKFGNQHYSRLDYEIVQNSLTHCYSAGIDLGADKMDPGLTPNGAKCGKGKMCVNQRCKDVAGLKNEATTCTKRCNGQGWCNNAGHCHCNNGYAPPFCNEPGPGGSEDSGPASNPKRFLVVQIAIFTIFLGVIPTVAIITCCFNYKVKQWKKSPSIVTADAIKHIQDVQATHPNTQWKKSPSTVTADAIKHIQDVQATHPNTQWKKLPSTVTADAIKHIQDVQATHPNTQWKKSPSTVTADAIKHIQDVQATHPNTQWKKSPSTVTADAIKHIQDVHDTHPNTQGKKSPSRVTTDATKHIHDVQVTQPNTQWKKSISTDTMEATKHIQDVQATRPNFRSIVKQLELLHKHSIPGNKGNIKTGKPAL